MAPRRLQATLIGCVLLSLGCAQILGVEPGRCAPELEGCEGEPPSSPPAAPKREAEDRAPLDAGRDDPEAAPDSGEAPEQQLCEEYCETVMVGCPEGGEPERPQQYASEERCVSTCVAELNLADNEVERKTGSTIDCRLLHAQLAADNLETRESCQSAGLGGGDVCGNLCDVYCELVESVCRPQFESRFGDDFSTCVEACEQVPLADDASFGMKAPNGNHMQCRIYHLQTAISASIPHCDHAVGDSPCQ